MADRVNYPKMGDNDTLEDYKRTVLEFFGVRKITAINIYYIWSNMKAKCYNPSKIRDPRIIKLYQRKKPHPLQSN